MFKPEIVAQVRSAVESHPGFDFQKASFKGKNDLSALGIERDNPRVAELIEAFNGYQRLVRIIPKEFWRFAIRLLERGIHSAVQIAGMSKQRFCEDTREIWDEEAEVAEKVHDNARVKRSRIVLQYIDQKQNNEPHAKAARI